jgi:ectoine hydroxylase-related dioxygenase (phytanoyl-CoA dioxygenase family)
MGNQNGIIIYFYFFLPLRNQEQEIGIANRAVHEASLMQSMQERLLAPTDVERLAAIKRVKQTMSKARPSSSSSSMGFGKSLSSKGKGKSTTIDTKSILKDNSSQQPSSTPTIKPPFLADKEGYNAILEENGVVRINNVLDKDTAQVLYSYICEAKVEAEKSISEGKLDIRSRFSDALLKKNRYDFLLPLEESTLVMRGLYETLVRNKILSTIISSRFGNDAELYELGALISDPGSDRQVIHPDIPFQSQQLVRDNNQNHNNMPLLTCFISLQEIDQSMGGTIFLPKTNTEEHHRLLKDHSARDGMLQTSPNKLSTLGVGDCSIFDARLLHAGGANSSSKRRILFYFTFRNPALPNPRLPNNPGSIRRELKERNLTLSQIQEIVSNAMQQEEISR